MLRMLLAGLLLWVILVYPLAASTVVYEGFDYPPGDLIGRAGGTGFSGPWTVDGFNATSGAHRIDSGSLTYSGVTGVGNRMSMPSVTAIGGARRKLASELGKNGQTVYFSFLVRAEGALGQGNSTGFFGVYLDSVKGEPDLFIGKPGGDDLNSWVLEDRGGSGQVSSRREVVVGRTVQLVVKAEFRSGNDRFSLFVNPPRDEPAQADVVKTDVDLGIVDAIVIYNGGAFSLDQLRLGTAFGDVTQGAPTAPPTLTTTAPGGITLPPGFRHEQLPGIDSRVGRIFSDQLDIRYDIGALAGNYAESARDFLWFREQIVRGNWVQTVMKKNRQLIVTVSAIERGGPQQPRGRLPANFFATIEREQDLADMLLIVMSYTPETN